MGHSRSKSLSAAGCYTDPRFGASCSASCKTSGTAESAAEALGF